jgi:hypothetical protein
MIRFKQSGNFNNSEKFLTRAQKIKIELVLEKYGHVGVAALSSATPKDTGYTADAWDYEVSVKDSGYSIAWTNSSVTPDGIPIVILLQYGHGNGKGGYVEGRDFINPAMRPIFDKVAENLWQEVTKL